MSEKYFGAFCAQCNVWLRKADNSLLYYRSAVLMQADLNTDLGLVGGNLYRPHLYAVTEFGAEQPVDYEKLPAGSEICPALRDRRDWETQRQSLIFADARMNP